jgi:flagellar protein FlgJ
LRAAQSQRRAGAPVSEDGLKAVCEDMEALFIHHMLSEMRKTVAKSGLIDGGRSEEIYTSLMDAELAKEMSRSGGLGLSSILQEQLGAFSGRGRRVPRNR